jgi:mannose-6-phosphate isomerase-like protein (cupin superfamily)
MTQAVSTRTGQNFTVADLGSFSELQQFTFAPQTVPIKLEGKVFLKQILNLSSAEISLNTLPPNTSVPFYHKHHLNEEIYIFVKGKGEFQVDDTVFAIGEGTTVRIDPEGERCLRNTSNTEALVWIVIQSRAGSYSDHTIQDGFAVQKPVRWRNQTPI